jgi:hypothetical protein
MIQIARNGEILGAVTEAEFSEGIAQGRILATDHWWKEGMDAWTEVGADNSLATNAQLERVEEALKAAERDR